MDEKKGIQTGTGAALGVPTERQMTGLEKCLGVADDTHNRIHSLAARATALADKMEGTNPQAVGEGPDVSPQGQIGTLSLIQDNQARGLNSLTDAIVRLEALI